MYKVSYCKSGKKIWAPITIFSIILQVIDRINTRRNNLFFPFHIKSFIKVTDWSGFIIIMPVSYIRCCKRMTSTIYNLAFSFFADLHVNKTKIFFYSLMITIKYKYNYRYKAFNYLWMNTHIFT